MSNIGYLQDKNNNQNYAITDSEWKSLSPYYNNVTDWRDGFRTGRYKKRDTEVCLEGTLKFTTASQTIMTLPQELRPLQHMNFNCTFDTANSPKIAKIVIESSGAVKMQDFTPNVGSWIALNGIKYFTD